MDHTSLRKYHQGGMLKIVEVRLRKGLQNEIAQVPTSAKVAFVDALSQTGVHRSL